MDAALRERITRFYKLHAEGNGRQAEEFVAPDTKDYFYNSNKPRYRNSEIRKIEYSADFTQATALIVAVQPVLFAGSGSRAFRMPHTSRWKLVDGQWYWWVDPEEVSRTPFGKLGTADPDAPQGSAPSLEDMPDVGAVLAMVRCDKTAVTLKPEVGSADAVRVSNSMPGRAQLALSAEPPEGVDVSIDSPSIEANASATVAIRVTDPAKAPKRAIVTLVVQPLGKLFPITVSVGTPD